VRQSVGVPIVNHSVRRIFNIKSAYGVCSQTDILRQGVGLTAPMRCIANDEATKIVQLLPSNSRAGCSLFLDAVRFAHLGTKTPVKSEAKNPSTFSVPDLLISHSALDGIVL